MVVAVLRIIPRWLWLGKSVTICGNTSLKKFFLNVLLIFTLLYAIIILTFFEKQSGEDAFLQFPFSYAYFGFVVVIIIT